MLYFQVSIATLKETEEDTRDEREKVRISGYYFFQASHESVISFVNVKEGAKEGQKRGMKHTKSVLQSENTPDGPDKHTPQWFKGV